MTSFMNPLALLDRIGLLPLSVVAIALGLAPFRPQPHLFEKLQMLTNGTLHQPVDIFDLAMHGAPVVILLVKLARMFNKSGKADAS